MMDMDMKDRDTADQTVLYRLRADAAWRAVDRARREHDEDAADLAIREARYWELMRMMSSR